MVCLIYKSEVHTEVKGLRWFLFSNRADEGESLPPTTGSLNYTYGELTTSRWYGEEQQRATFPSVICCICLGTSCGRRGLYTHSMCSSPSSWSSNKSGKMWMQKGCTGLCSCSKNNIPCTEVCCCVDYSCNSRHNAVEHLVAEEAEEDDYE